jgi:hypothetical protein
VPRQGSRHRVGLDDVITFLGQPLAERPSNQLLIVDHEDGCARHVEHSSAVAPSSAR